MQSLTNFNRNDRQAGGQWTCDICAAVFQRLDHYKRHSKSHQTDKPFMCNFCGSLYKRGDVLRRHWKTCPGRINAGQAIPEPRLGGKEKHACDGCARLKRSCSGGKPCSECSSRGKLCSYQRLGVTDLPSKEWGDADKGRAVKPLEVAPSTWDLGPQTFYPSRDVCYQAYSRLS